MKKLWKDRKGQDTLAGIMIMLTVFILTAGLLIGLFQSAQAEYDLTAPGIQILIGGTSYDAFEPVAGRDITWANASDSYHPWPNPKSMHFWIEDDANPFHLTVIRNNSDVQTWGENDEWFKYNDYIGIEKNWGLWDTGRIAIPIGGICDMHNTSAEFYNTEYVVWEFQFWDTLVLIVEATSASTFFDEVFNNNTFTAYIGVATFSATAFDSTSIWDVFWSIFSGIGMLFTFGAFPEVPILSYLISGMIWMALIYVGFTIVQRVWSGGG